MDMISSGVRRSWWLIGLAALAMAAGCRRADHSPLGQLQGTVRFQGQPIAEGTLIFEVRGARPAHGRIVDGSITEVSTYQAGDGVPVGLAQVAVFVQEPAPSLPRSLPPDAASSAPSADASLTGTSSRNQAIKSLIPERYNDPATSRLACEIHPGTNQILLDLQAP